MARASKRADKPTPAPGKRPAKPAALPSARAREVAARIADPASSEGRAVRAMPAYRMLPIDSLVPYENNARQHSPEQVNLLTKMISRFGWTNPVLIDAKKGILAGHGRVLAARQLGMDAVPTIEISHLSATERRAYIIADNQSALRAGYDNDLLRLELGELRDDGFDLELTGFETDEIDRLFGDGSDVEPEPLTGQDAEHTAVCPKCGHEFTP